MAREPKDPGGWSGGGDWRGDGTLGGSYESAGGGGEVSNDWSKNSTWNQPPATPSTPPAGGGEPDFASQQRQSGERDEDSYSKDQWSAWDKEEAELRKQGKSASQLTPGGCPPQRPYTSRPGPDGKVECAFKPDDCPDGTHVVGTPGKCVAGAPGSEYGAGGSGGAGGSSSSSGSSAPAPKQKKIVDYKPQRDQVYGGGTLASKPGGQQFSILAGGTPPQQTSQQILSGGVGAFGLPTAPTAPTTSSVFPGAATTGQEAVGRGGDSLLWPSVLGGGL